MTSDGDASMTTILHVRKGRFRVTQTGAGIKAHDSAWALNQVASTVPTRSPESMPSGVWSFS